jgi:hypothetical protein
MARTSLLRWPLVLTLVAGGLYGASSCGIRNLGESCNIPGGPVGDVFCAPGRCDPDKQVCVECVNDMDCLPRDPLDRPKCMKGLSLGEGGDNLPFCKHYADHGACGYPGVGAVICAPGKCHPDAGVCVDCLEDGDCPPDKPTCDPGVPPDNLPFCRKK